MMRAFALEFAKIRRRKTGWMVIAVMVVQLMWMLWSFSRMDERDLQQGWENCFFMLPLLNSIIMPLLAAVVASRIVDIEHKGQTLRLLETVMPAGRLFDAKLFCGAVHMVFAVLLQLAVILPVGLSKGFAGPLPLDKVVLYILFSSAVNLTILLLQQILSLLFPNQMVALSVGVAGSFIALFCLYLPPQVERLLLWGYYGELMIVRMDWYPATRITNYYWEPANWAGFMILLVVFLVMYLAGRVLFNRKEL